MGHDGLVDEEARRVVEGDAVDAVAVGDAVDELPIAVRRADIVDPAVAETARGKVAHGNADGLLGLNAKGA